MIKIIGSDAEVKNTIFNALKEKIETIQLNWKDKIEYDEETIFIISDYSKEYKAILLKLIESGNRIIIYSEEEETDEFQSENIIRICPSCFEPEEIGIVCKWCLYNIVKSKKKTEDLEALNKKLINQTEELKTALNQIEDINKAMLEELQLASEFQKSLLPSIIPKNSALSIEHKYIPYLKVGGDFFDIVKVDKKNIGIVISDASGHGVASAFITSMFKSAFVNHAKNNLSPADVLTKINQEFTQILISENFVTAFYIIINTETLNAQYASAGHPNQLLFRKDKSTEELRSFGLLLGMFDNSEYKEESIKLRPGDKICLYTDGILETSNSQNEQFGRENIKKILLNNNDKSIEELSNLMITELIGYMEKPFFEDDITFLIIEAIESI